MMPSGVGPNVPNAPNRLPDAETFHKLLDNSFAVLEGKPEPHALDATDLHVKQFYAVLLSLTAHFVKDNRTTDEIKHYLTDEYNFDPPKVEKYLRRFEEARRGIEASLLNVGSHLPSVTDVRWRIDYIVKSSMVDESEGPLFRVCLVTERYAVEESRKVVEYIDFTCTSQEMQDLIYKLKDAARHCHLVMNRM